MSIVQCCPYSDEKENCKFEIYYGQPRFDKCSTCKRMKKHIEIYAGGENMTVEERYKRFINTVCVILGFNKPIDILKLCQITSDFIIPFETKIKDLEQVNEQLKSQIEKMIQDVSDMKYFTSFGTVTKACEELLRKWELAE